MLRQKNSMKFPRGGKATMILNTKRAEDDDRLTHTATSMTTGFEFRFNFNLSLVKKIRKLCHDTAGQSEEKASKFGHQEHRCQLVWVKGSARKGR